MTRTAVLLGLLFLVDAVAVGQGLFSLFLVAPLGLALLAIGALWSFLRGDRARARSRILKAAAYLLLGVATAGVLRLHAYTAWAGAERIIAACRQHQAATGRLPDTLQELVPRHLGSIPRAKWTLAWGEYEYGSSPAAPAGDQAAHWLSFVAMPPFGRRVYLFEQDKWVSRD